MNYKFQFNQTSANEIKPVEIVTNDTTIDLIEIRGIKPPYEIYKEDIFAIYILDMAA